nr:AprI/Inh family metalloprotease inhibitor [Nitrobacter winogradskyi]
MAAPVFADNVDGGASVLRKRRAVLVAAALLMSCGPALSQDSPALKKNMIGQWELSTTERSRTCVVTLKGETAPQGLKLDLEPGCVASLPFTKDIAAWTVAGLDIVRLQTATGESVIDFTEVESGILEGRRENDGIYILQNLAEARSLARSMDQMIGDWAFVRSNGQPICGITLTNTEAPPDSFQAFLKPKCDPAIAGFKPEVWRLDRGEILLMSAGGETWHFQADDNAQWRLVPDSANPLILIRR